MKKTRINLFASLALAALMVSCAGLDKMKKDAPGVKYTVTPEVLETHAGKVDVEIKVQIPEKYFDKKVSLEATPVLVYEGGETAFPAYKLQGESFEGNDKVISYTNGGSFTYNNSVEYNENMRVSDLVVRIKATKGSNTSEFDDFKIADGVIATSSLVADQGAQAAIGADGFERIIPEEKLADIYFLIQQANVRGTELRKEEIAVLKDFIKEAQAAENKEFKGVQISAYASPDGPTDLNTKIASKREKAAKDYLARELKKAKVEGAQDADFFTLKNTPEDWEGFKTLMENSDVQDKELILRVLSMYSDPEVREREIKNMSETFKVIADDILPKLRRSKMAVNVDVIGKSDEELTSISKSSPSDLNIEELLYAATLTKDAAEQEAIYTAAAAKYPKCWRAQNNVGVALYAQGKVAEAKTAFEKANTIKAGVAEVNNNLGVVALRDGDLAKAEEFFGAAAGAGAELDNNLGIVSIHKGEYDNAIRYFGNSTNCNAALAKILAGKYDAALSTINANTMEVGFKYYLKAIVGARTGQNDLMFDALRKATELDGKFKGLAVKDLEFAKFFEDATFKSIVQ
ncbi:tetratricopeptide repeat protein [Carboxylicivirga sp. N1Y90]|uniref:tetratricopeptide repeat protein n=1 Tax=Carboxylicivirga fragile TaxID=3417571 RepID=UPI003D34EC31|nr:tetratricopeptide repeat protein [Marinilabiliaceae bacterium N1Y90]